MQARRFLRSTALLIVALAALAAGLTAARFTGMAEPGISQEHYHVQGTRTRHADFSAWVRQKPVVVDPPERSAVDILEKYVTRIWNGQPLGGVQGEYDIASEEIRILGDEVRLQSRMPEELRGELYHVVRHEYGHAAFFDWLAEKGLSDLEAARIGLLNREAAGGDEALPPELVPVVEEWRAGPEFAYIDPYLTSNLAEYLAESYARVLEGAPVPDAAEAFVIREYRGVGERR